MVSTTDPMRSTPCSTSVDHGGGALDVAGESVDGVDGSRHAAAAPPSASWLVPAVAWDACSRVVGHFSNGTDHLAHGAGKLFNLGELLVDGLVRLLHTESHLGGDLVELLCRRHAGSQTPLEGSPGSGPPPWRCRRTRPGT